MQSTLAEEITRIRHLDVLLEGTRVGTLAQNREQRVLFEYDSAWLAQGFSISPFSLPLRQGIFEPPPSAAESMHGIFADSLPDDWGRLLQDRQLESFGVRAQSLTPLARLYLVGNTGLGALEYVPSASIDALIHSTNFDELLEAAHGLLSENTSEALDTLYTLGSSSGGARPKLMVNLDELPWIVKFPMREDGLDSGAREYRYALAAQACGIVVPEVALIPSRLCSGFFATRRFDRVQKSDGRLAKIHMASAAALLEITPFDVADYRDLMQLCLTLTDDVSQCEQLYRVMCFNVFAENCDDHAKNFSFLCDGGVWQLTPAYDLTHDTGFYGEHATLVNGRAGDITADDLIVVGKLGALQERVCKRILNEIRGVVYEHLEDLLDSAI